MGIVEVVVNLNEEFVSNSTQTLWGLVFLLLSILWANIDANRNSFEKPFDFGFLVYIFWPIALPWYLYTTRGVEGLLIFLGFITIWLGPWLSGLIAYVYYL